MPTMTEVKHQRELLRAKYGDLPTVSVTTRPVAPLGAAPPEEPVAEVVEEPVREPVKTKAIKAQPEKRGSGGNSVKLTNAQIAGLAGLAIKYGTDWKRQLDQAIAQYFNLRDDMPEDEWEDLELDDEMRSELL